MQNILGLVRLWVSDQGEIQILICFLLICYEPLGYLVCLFFSVKILLAFSLGLVVWLYRNEEPDEKDV